MRAIIPCAGFGTRMGMEPTQSKEMLIDPKSQEPLINYALNLCVENGIEPLIVTREEKIDLIEHAKRWSVEVQIIKPEGEWPNTILMSQPNWHEHNILILPDTRFGGHNIIRNMRTDLELGATRSIALHEVRNGDPSKWCVLHDYSLIEKPHAPLTPPIEGHFHAMGLVAWNKYSGWSFWNDLAKPDLRGFKVSYCSNTSFQYLDYFVDVTRTGKVE